MIDLTMALFGASGTGKTYSLTAISKLEGMTRPISFRPEDITKIWENLQQTLNVLDYKFTFQKSDSNGNALERYRVTVHDPVGGELMAPRGDSESLRQIQAVGGIDFVVTMLDPKDLFSTQVHERQSLLQMLDAWVASTVSRDRPAYRALVLTRADELGFHYSEMGRFIATQDEREAIDSWAKSNFDDQTLAETVQTLAAAKHHGNEELWAEFARRSASAWRRMFQATLAGRNSNVYATSACPHVPSSKQIGDTRTVAGAKELVLQSAGLEELISDFQRWICDFNHGKSVSELTTTQSKVASGEATTDAVTTT